MPIAAVPQYLGQDFKDVSPGLRFGLLLPIWTNRQDQEREVNRRAEARSREGDEVRALLQKGMDHAIHQLRQRQQRPLPGLWDKNDFAAREAWKSIQGLTLADRDVMKGLAGRQTALSATVPAESLLRLDALAIAPFTTGLGNEHPLENGFAFLNPYGLPYLPGSGVKGVLRQAARELASGQWGKAHGWSDERTFTPGAGKGRIALSTLDALFGLESGDGDTQHMRGALTFWDVIPQIKGDSLMVEIMTPHQGHYYQQNRDRKTGDSTSPHDSGQPIPISFLTVPPGSSFAFHVVCDMAFLHRLAPPLAESDPATGKPIWQALMAAAFAHAFDWLGFGAKTAVGYGAMRRDEEAEAKAEGARAEKEAEARRQREEADRAARRASLSENERRIEDFIEKARGRQEQLRGGREKPNTGVHSLAQQLVNAALGGDWSADERRALAEAIEEWLPKVVERFDRKDDWKDARKKLKIQQLKGDAP